MNSDVSDPPHRNLGFAAAVIALAIVMVGGAALIYYLLDILLVLFLGIVVAAALQPGHRWLSHWGVRKGTAVLLFYTLFLIVIGLVAIFIGPTLFEQLSTFVAELPKQYSQFVNTLQTSTSPLLQQLGRRFPTANELIQRLSAVFPSFVADLLQFMTSTVAFFAYFVVVFAIGFYWTMEVPRFQRLVLSLLPVARRPQVLTTWHEIEAKLGAFVRAQGLAMLIVGIISGIGYWLIGLPNVMVLAVLAGLLEAVPIIGPILAAVPAILVAIPEGLSTVALVIGFATLVQLFENNVLIPRIMNSEVGISSLVGLFAILAFGTLYGVLGAFIAIPLTVVIQVLLNHIIINPEPLREEAEPTLHPLAALRTRLQELRQQIRQRLRERDTQVQLGTAGPTADHVADAVEQKLEKAVEKVESLVTTAQQDTTTITTEERQAVASELQQTTGKIERTVQRLEQVLPVTDSEKRTEETLVREPVVAELERATDRIEQEVQHAETVLTEAQQNDEVPPVVEKVAAPPRSVTEKTGKAK